MTGIPRSLPLCFLLLAPDFSARAQSASEVAGWARESSAFVEEAFWNSKNGLYSEKSVVGEDGVARPTNQPSFNWGAGVQFAGLAAAARIGGPEYRRLMERYADALDRYWIEHNGIAGYNCMPGGNSDRYYDDNAWVVLALVDAYEVTRDLRYLSRAEETMKFVMSGEDDKLGGGLYWQENKKGSKNTCTNAPAITALLRLYKVTKKPQYLEDAHRIYTWTCKNLQEDNGIFNDHINLEGKVTKWQFTYNTALMISANSLIYEITKNRKYLDEARRLALAAEDKWIKPDGGVSDAGSFSHLLMKSYMDLAEVDSDPRWLNLVRRTAKHLHDQKDRRGGYPENWNADGKDDNSRTEKDSSERYYHILDQASVPCFFWEAADALR